MTTTKTPPPGLREAVRAIEGKLREVRAYAHIPDDRDDEPFQIEDAPITVGDVRRILAALDHEDRGEGGPRRLTEAEVAEAVRVHDAMHPDGACTCAGDGDCLWCRTHCTFCGVRIGEDEPACAEHRNDGLDGNGRPPPPTSEGAPGDQQDTATYVWRCSACGVAADALPAPSWRWNGHAWEHQHGAQVGYFVARCFGRWADPAGTSEGAGKGLPSSVERGAASFAKYHAEHARYGGASFEFHARAETFILDTATALTAARREATDLREQLDTANDTADIAEQQRDAARRERDEATAREARVTKRAAEREARASEVIDRERADIEAARDAGVTHQRIRDIITEYGTGEASIGRVVEVARTAVAAVRRERDEATALVEKFRAYTPNWEEVNALRSECDRLRGEAEAARAGGADARADADAFEAQRDTARAEAARLRGAVEAERDEIEKAVHALDCPRGGDRWDDAIDAVVDLIRARTALTPPTPTPTDDEAGR